MRTDDDIVFVEPDPGFDPDDDLRPTENAIGTIFDRGVFTLDAEREFDVLVYAPSARELREFFALVGAYDQSPDNPTNSFASGTSSTRGRKTSWIDRRPTRRSSTASRRGCPGSSPRDCCVTGRGRCSRSGGNVRRASWDR